MASGFKGLDDDHPPAAARTSIPLFVFATIFCVVARPARRSRVGYPEQPADQCNVVGPVGIGEQAVVPDAVETVGQDVDQKAARGREFVAATRGRPPSLRTYVQAREKPNESGSVALAFEPSRSASGPRRPTRGKAWVKREGSRFSKRVTAHPCALQPAVA